MSQVTHFYGTMYLLQENWKIVENIIIAEIFFWPFKIKEHNIILFRCKCKWLDKTCYELIIKIGTYYYL